jgi:hypothetical protein
MAEVLFILVFLLCITSTAGGFWLFQHEGLTIKVLLLLGGGGICVVMLLSGCVMDPPPSEFTSVERRQNVERLAREMLYFQDKRANPPVCFSFLGEPRYTSGYNQSHATVPCDSVRYLLINP